MGCVACLLRERGLFDASVGQGMLGLWLVCGGVCLEREHPHLTSGSLSLSLSYTHTPPSHVICRNGTHLTDFLTHTPSPSPPSPSSYAAEPEGGGSEWGAYDLQSGSLAQYVRIDR